MFPGRKGAFVISALADKDFPGILTALRGRIGAAWAVMLAGERARSAADLKSSLAAAGIRAEVLPLAEAIAAARQQARADGSFVAMPDQLFLIGDALALLGRDPLPRPWRPRRAARSPGASRTQPLVGLAARRRRRACTPGAGRGRGAAASRYEMPWPAGLAGHGNAAVARPRSSTIEPGISRRDLA
ncbi:MAG: hypothetical protein U1F87_11410 [Kiritimatiellia bacterium]